MHKKALKRCIKCREEIASTWRHCANCGATVSASNSENTENEINKYTFQSVAGEHKNATILFIDITASLELIRGSDPEWIEGFIDPQIKLMIDTIHQHEGTILQVVGDGLLAVFGAPVAYEDHAVRACNAALSLFAVFGELKAGDSSDKEIRIKIGINSGEVVISPIRITFNTEYRALGETTWLASRLEMLAKPGEILISQATRRLIEGFFYYKQLEKKSIKGYQEKDIPIYQLLGRTGGTRYQALVNRGLTPFVGREGVLEGIRKAINKNVKRSTLCIVLRGEAGIGKSRLAYELIEKVKNEYTVLELSGTTYGRSPFGVLQRMLQIKLMISPDDKIVQICGLVDKYIESNPKLKNNKDALLSLLDLPVENELWKTLDATVRKNRQFELAKIVLKDFSKGKPMLLLAEDIQWFDNETLELLRMLQGNPIGSKAVILATERVVELNEREKFPGAKVFTLKALAKSKAQMLIESKLGTVLKSKESIDRIIKLTDCNPFYIEETVQALMERKGHEKLGLLNKNGSNEEQINIPPSVESVVMSRIDRVQSDLREVIQVAAVIKDDIDSTVLARILPLDWHIKMLLDKLVDMDILILEHELPSRLYRFRHSLIGEIVYQNMHTKHKIEIHARVLGALEKIYVGRISEKLDKLAFHASQSHEWMKAVNYYKQVALKSAAHSANTHASKALSLGLYFLDNIPESKEKIRQAIDLRLLGLRAILPLGNHAKIRQLLAEAEKLSKKIGDEKSLGNIYGQLALSMWIICEYANAVDYANKALYLNKRINSFPLLLSARHTIGMVQYSTGRMDEAIKTFTEIIEILDKQENYSNLGWVGYPASICRTFLGASLTLTGDFDHAIEVFNAGKEIANKVKDPYSLALLLEEYAFLLMETGDLNNALRELNYAYKICRKHNLANVQPSVSARLVLGHIMAGNFQFALEHAEQALAGNSQYIGGKFANNYLKTAYAKAQLYCGREELALSTIGAVIKQTKSWGEKPNYATALILAGEIHMALGLDHLDKAERSLNEAFEIAESSYLLPMKALSLANLGKLHFKQNKKAQSDEEIKSAIKLFESLGMRRNIKQYQPYLVSNVTHEELG